MGDSQFDTLPQKMNWMREVLKRNRDKFKTAIYDTPVRCDACGKHCNTVLEFKWIDMQQRLHWMTICQNCWAFLTSDIG
jgi:hypothetical protein